MIKLIKSSFYNEKDTKEKLSNFILESNIFSMGEQCASFEKKFAEKQGRKYAVYVANGSVANLLLIQALLNIGLLKKGDRVGFSALTWSTNVMPIIQLGLVPVAIDCNPETLNISPQELNEKISELDALFLTNVLGFSDDISAIKKICDDKGILFLEDNCESMGSIVDDKQLGNFGLASTFSFFVGHHLSTIEGGMVCTDDEEVYINLVLSRAHGWDRNLSEDQQNNLRKKHGINNFYARYTFYDIASNFRPTEINGFIGNTQIQYWDEIVTKRANNFDRFLSAQKANEDFMALDLSHMDLISNFAMPIICKTKDLSNVYRKKFEDFGVEIRPIIAGNITHQPFYRKYVTDVTPLPNSDFIHENGFYFGNNPELTNDEVNSLCTLLEK